MIRLLCVAFLGLSGLLAVPSEADAAQRARRGRVVVVQQQRVVRGRAVIVQQRVVRQRGVRVNVGGGGAVRVRVRGR